MGFMAEQGEMDLLRMPGGIGTLEELF